MSAKAKAFLESIALYSAPPVGAKALAQDRPIMLATVDPAYTGSGPAKVTFDGEAVMSSKAYIATTAVAPGSRVYLLPIGKSYVIAGVIGGGAMALGNLLVNGEFRVNQRGYVSAAALAVGSYGFDRWASTVAGSTLTFSAGAQATIVTLNAAGAIRQTVERANVRAGSYALAWTGTAVARVYNASGAAPAYAASPIMATLDGADDVRVEFYGGGAVASTLGAVQLVAGTTSGAVEHLPLGDELRRCQRYYYRMTAVDSPYQNFAMGLYPGTTTGIYVVRHPVTMRGVPTFESSAASTFGGSAFTQDVPGRDASRLNLTVTGATGGQGANLQANSTNSAYIGFSAEF